MSLTGLLLHLNKFKQFNVTLDGAVLEGAMAVVENCVGVYASKGAIGDVVSFIYWAEWLTLPKTAGTGITFAAGDKVYYDSVAAAVTNVSSGNTFCGIARKAALFSDTSLDMELDGGAHRAA